MHLTSISFSISWVNPIHISSYFYVKIKTVSWNLHFSVVLKVSTTTQTFLSYIYFGASLLPWVGVLLHVGVCVHMLLFLFPSCYAWLLLDVAFCYFRSAYENSVYCDSFHLEETGWRDCSSCGKVSWLCGWPDLFQSLFLLKSRLIRKIWYYLTQRLHCGCIASKSLYEFLDYGGVGCTSCASSSQFCSVRSTQIMLSYLILILLFYSNLRFTYTKLFLWLLVSFIDNDACRQHDNRE